MNIRTITVKGVGSIAAKTDWIVIAITQKTTAKIYAEMMQKAAVELEQIRQAVVDVGYPSDELK
ncbi:MAG: hypothetical protein LBT23_10450, partial [Synergistaceae bacterium]|nr:hypothetical protein [Synergistaceae bacterium]